MPTISLVGVGALSTSANSRTDSRFADAGETVAQLPFRRYPTSLFLRRAYELRQNVSSYDSVYVALDEILDCELLTCDRRLARATGEAVPPSGVKQRLQPG